MTIRCAKIRAKERGGEAWGQVPRGVTDEGTALLTGVILFQRIAKTAERRPAA
ncbi:hypothetical protein NRB_39300 [Novosphingobium sp. 11B]